MARETPPIPADELGRRAEDYAERWLTRRGAAVIDRRYRSRFGEIDIVAVLESTLLFVEVRCRLGNRFGGPGTSIDRHKVHKLELTARHYLLTHPEHSQRACRLDAILISSIDPVRIEWLQGIVGF